MSNVLQTADNYGYIKLDKEEATKSKATHQAKSMYDAGELYALTLDIDGDRWLHRDHRGYLSGQGEGAVALAQHLQMFVEED